MQAHPGAAALHAHVLDAHLNNCPDTREGINHDPDQGPVSKANRKRDINCVEQLACLIGRQDRGFTFLNDMLWPLDRACRSDGDHLADHQPVKEHPDCCKLQLDRGRSNNFTRLLDIGRDMERADLDQLAYAVIFTLGGEGAGRAHVGFAGVGITDLGGEKLDDPFGSLRIGSKKRRQRPPDLLSYYRQLFCHGPSPNLFVLYM